MNNNIFSNIQDNIAKEVVDNILTSDNIKIERIVSKGQASPDGFWYDQDKNEWVILLQGSAGLQFYGEKDVVVLKSGSYINIKAHKKHRVKWTAKDKKTIWLTIFYS